ncbi:zinc finger protein Xfin-like [Mercenaria mercenaria]|uniref:zinc finger protein Xfin-like n=1 Tax=Mercenaria mercenaria TaxID=6596 RepID=UPI00234F656B|nr:zinc finger protein Xfin-like [Mercenaria mercenaria]XP_045189284.2 zinc finger protein Xfin-like [Mercenaria mercenaria]
MCLQAKRKKYMYMSMCSCCHAVSKYSSAVKTHLVHEHAQHPVKKGLKVVIPVRIDRRYERHIGMSLDKKRSLKDLKRGSQKPAYLPQKEKNIETEKDKNISKSSHKRNLIQENSILCTFCKKKFDNLMSYIVHLSTEDHRNMKICFKCTHCDSLCQNLGELVNHNKKHNTENLSVSQLDCFDSGDSDIITDVCNLPCPYCFTSFQEIEQIYKHVGDVHCGQIDVMKIKTEEEDEAENQGQKCVIAVFKCKYCNESFHALNDIIQHVSEKHNMTERQTRKRTLPKWLQEYEEDERSQIKKIRNDLNSRKSRSRNNSPKKKVVQNLPVDLSPIVVLENIEFDVDGGSSGNRNVTVQSALEFSNKTVQDSNFSSFSHNQNADKNEGQRKEASELDHDYFIKDGMSRQAGEKLQDPLDQNKSLTITDYNEESLITEDIDEHMDCNSDSGYRPEDKSNSGMKQRRVPEPEIFKCPYCESKQYPWLKSLNRHIKVKHPDDELLKIKDFNKRKSDQNFSGLSYDDYRPEDENNSYLGKNGSQEGELFKCPYCEGKEYPRMKSLNRHIREKHPGCDTITAKDKAKIYEQNQYKSPATDYQKEETIMNETDDPMDETLTTETDNQMKETLLTEAIDEHLEGDSDDDYKPEEESNSELSDSEEKTSPRLKMFKCEHCEGKEYTQRKTLVRHIKLKHPGIMQVNTKEEKKYYTKRKDNELCFRYKCPFCAFSLHHREYVFSHIERAHSEVLHFTLGDIVKEPVTTKKSEINRECFHCPHCDFISRWKADLKSHCIYHHPGENLPNNIPCILPGNWVDRYSLSAKLLCPLCQAVTEGKENLQKHLREHVSGKGMNISFHTSLPEPDTMGKQPFKKLTCFLCPYCDCVFKRKDSYHFHLNTHEERMKERSESPSIKCVVIKQESALPFSNKTTRSEHAKHTNEENGNVTNDPARKTHEQTKSAQGKENAEFETGKVLSTDIKIRGKENYLNLKHNEIKVDTNVNISHDKSKLVAGTYICPVCDHFKTFSKEIAVRHVEDNHKSKISEIDIMYIVPFIFLEGNKTDMTVNKNTTFSFGCRSCTFSSVIITDAVKHSKKHRIDIGKDIEYGMENSNLEIIQSNMEYGIEFSNQEDVQDTDTVEPKLNPLFDIVSCPSTEYGNSDALYKCWSCDPYYLFKTRKGYRKHMITQHEDAILCEVGEAMNQILELMEDKESKRYLCLMCSETMESEQDLVDHFKARYPDKVSELIGQLNNKPNMKNKQNLTAESECEICDAGFSDDFALRRHLLLHLNKFKIHCPTCGILFHTKEEVATHIAGVHSKSTEMCNICGKLFWSHKDFLRHMRGHEPGADGTKGARMLCQHCGTEIRRQSFRRHLLRYHANHITCECDICTTQKAPAGVTPLMCNLCSRVFCTNFFLTAHQKKEHGMQNNTKQDKHNSDGEKGSEEFKCIGCDMIFESQSSLQLHSHHCDKSHRTLKLEEDGKRTEMSESEFDMNDKVLLSANISAEDIKENFLEYNSSSNLPYTCLICRRSFRVPKYMYEHVRRKHASAESKRFRCKVCKMTFNRSSSLKQHCKRHIGIRPHQCNICKKAFKTTSHLKEHTRIHTDGEAPQYTCGYCGNKFLQNGALMAHVIHHDKLRPYKCPFCQRGYTTTGDLKRHMDKYDKNIEKKGLICSYCKQPFPNIHYLLKHFQTHFIKDPFHCTICQKKFSSFREMYTHKDQNKHFTESEFKEANNDLLTPGRMFRGKFNRRSKATKAKDINRETALATASLDKAPGENDQQSEKVVFEEEGCVEIEIPNNLLDSQDESAKDALSLFQNNVIQSMMDIVEEEHDSDKEEKEQVYDYGQQNQVEYVVELADLNAQSDVPVTTVVGSKNVEAIETENVTTRRETETDLDELASLVAQNVQSQEMGKTQTYQTADGSLIHVCVIKPTK